MSVQEDKHQKMLKKFQKLDESWRQAQLGAKTEEVYKVITQVAIATVSLDLAKELDPDLAALKEQVKVASEPYSEGKKQNSLKIQFCVENLRSRGEDVPDVETFLSAAAKRLLDQQS